MDLVPGESLVVSVRPLGQVRLDLRRVFADERGESAAGFLRRAVEWFGSMGITVERVMSDNGSCYRSTVHAAACRELGLRHLFTRPYRPRTNGKAERFIQTLLSEWAYARSYPSSAARSRALPGYLRWYNNRRPHSSLRARPPISRVSHLCGHDS